MCYDRVVSDQLSKHNTFVHYWYDVGTTSSTLVQHCTNVFIQKFCMSDQVYRRPMKNCSVCHMKRSTNHHRHSVDVVPYLDYGTEYHTCTHLSAYCDVSPQKQAEDNRRNDMKHNRKKSFTITRTIKAKQFFFEFQFLADLAVKLLCSISTKN